MKNSKTKALVLGALLLSTVAYGQTVPNIQYNSQNLDLIAPAGQFVVGNGYNMLNAPLGSNAYWNVLSMRHQNASDNYATQIAGKFDEDLLFFRNTKNNSNQPWSEIFHSGNINTLRTSLDLNLQAVSNTGSNFVNTDEINIVNTVSDHGPYLSLQSGSSLNTHPSIQAYSYSGGAKNLSLQYHGGNVGIGSVAPEAKLHVNSDKVMFTTSNGEHNLLFGDEGARYFSLYTPQGASRATIRNYSDNVDIITFLQDGNVGIGTSTPQEKLSINGKVRAHEIKVQTSGWPDYVFAEEYKPKTLAEIAQFIKVNKHLPEVPSAKEVEQNGVELGEMNKILLKKIEEMTLLLIEQNKRLEKLEQAVKKD